MIDIIPSILVSSKQEFLTQITALDHAVTHLQLDIADGHFVPNTTWSEPEIVHHIDDYTFELHLMDESPLETITLWKDISSVTRFIIHIESVEDIAAAITHVQMYGREVFLALNPNTPLSTIHHYIDLIDGVLFMGVTPGFQGQKLIPEVLRKIAQCRTTYPELYTELDGGVHEDTLHAIIESGVHAICPGSLVFKREHSPADQIAYIKNQLEKLDNQKTR